MNDNEIKELVLKWLLLLGCDWVNYGRARQAGFMYDFRWLVGQGLVKHKVAAEESPSFFEYKLTNKALQLLEEKL